MSGQASDGMKSTAGLTCMKILLTIFNFVFWISGIAILVLGVWLKMELHIYVEFTENYYVNTPYILIGVGAGIVVVGSLGCLCTVKGKSSLLYMYAVFLFLVFLAELTVAVAAFYYKGKIEEGFELGLQNAIEHYKDHETSIDRMQITLACCGKDRYTDYFKIDWDGKGISDTVPDSCCTKESPDCGKNPHNNTINEQGCASIVTDFMKGNFAVIGGVGIGFSFLQLFGCILSCCLAKHANKNKYEQVE